MDKSVKDSNPDVKIGIKMRVFNWHLHEAITRCGWTRAEAAARMGITPNTLYRYLSFKAYPSQERRLKISVVLGVGDEELFPARLEGFRMSSHPIEFAVTESNAALLMGVDDTEPTDSLAFLREALSKAVGSLPDSMRYVIDRRFGLTDGISRTLEEVGAERGVTRARIGQIEQSAIKALRHPSRRRFLRGFENLCVPSVSHIRFYD